MFIFTFLFPLLSFKSRMRKNPKEISDIRNFFIAQLKMDESLLSLVEVEDRCKKQRFPISAPCTIPDLSLEFPHDLSIRNVVRVAALCANHASVVAVVTFPTLHSLITMHFILEALDKNFSPPIFFHFSQLECLTIRSSLITSSLLTPFSHSMSHLVFW